MVSETSCALTAAVIPLPPLPAPLATERDLLKEESARAAMDKVLQSAATAMDQAGIALTMNPAVFAMEPAVLPALFVWEPAILIQSLVYSVLVLDS